MTNVLATRRDTHPFYQNLGNMIMDERKYSNIKYNRPSSWSNLVHIRRAIISKCYEYVVIEGNYSKPPG